ncbi:MAG: hypothetical protein KAI24_07165 [Planctomycetes bacterium]|nr:hypothetical protein [Planctomycetota bacterium]
MVRRSVALAVLLAVAGCGAVEYRPYPLDLDAPLPADAFARCKDVLLRRCETLTRAEVEPFLLQTAWYASYDPPGERRASVFRDPEVEHGLAVVVELRRLSLPMFGLPGWTEPRGDDAAERELAAALREALADPEPVGVSR